MQGTVENRSLLAGGVAFDIVWCWKDDQLQTSEYSLPDKYKGEVTNTTENVLGPAVSSTLRKAVSHLQLGEIAGPRRTGDGGEDCHG